MARPLAELSGQCIHKFSAERGLLTDYAQRMKKNANDNARYAQQVERRLFSY